MRLDWVRRFYCGSAGALLALSVPLSLFAQAQGAAAIARPSAVVVPFIGCKAAGQMGPLDAPKGASVAVRISPNVAQKLAYYQSAAGLGVLAPRGWHCFGTYGSGGELVLVSPEPIDAARIFSEHWNGLSGVAVVFSHRYGGTSGRFGVAEVIARVFPAHRAFVDDMMKSEPAPPPFPTGPYPTDSLTYRSPTVVEYGTPARTDGLGTHSWLKKSDFPIKGVDILIGDTPDLVHLSVRVSPELNGLVSAVVRQAELDAARLPR